MSWLTLVPRAAARRRALRITSSSIENLTFTNTSYVRKRIGRYFGSTRNVTGISGMLAP